MSSDTCEVCGGPIPEEYDKFDDNAPVYGDGYVYHIGCEGGVFREGITSTPDTELQSVALRAAATLDTVADSLEQFAQHNQAAECREIAEALDEAVDGETLTAEDAEGGT